MTEADKREIISKCRRVDSTGLYVMVFIVLMNSCDSETARLRRIEDRLKSIENTITNAPNKGVSGGSTAAGETYTGSTGSVKEKSE